MNVSEKIRYKPLQYVAFLKDKIKLLESLLIANNIEVLPDSFIIEGLQPNETFIIEMLLQAYPKAIDIYTIEERLPKRDHAKERDVRIARVYVAKIRGKLGKDIIVCTGSGGYKITISREEVIERARTRIERIERIKNDNL